MKFSKNKSSKRRINRKKYHNGNSNEKRIFMSSKLCKDLRKNCLKKTMCIRKGDEVKVIRGVQKGKVGKVIQCSRKEIFVYVDSITYKKKNGNETYLPIHPSNVEIQKLLLTNERKSKLTLIREQNKFSEIVSK